MHRVAHSHASITLRYTEQTSRSYHTRDRRVPPAEAGLAGQRCSFLSDEQQSSGLSFTLFPLVPHIAGSRFYEPQDNLPSKQMACLSLQNPRERKKFQCPRWPPSCSSWLNQGVWLQFSVSTAAPVLRIWTEDGGSLVYVITVLAVRRHRLLGFNIWCLGVPITPSLDGGCIVCMQASAFISCKAQTLKLFQPSDLRVATLCPEVWPMGPELHLTLALRASWTQGT